MRGAELADGDRRQGDLNPGGNWDLIYDMFSTYGSSSKLSTGLLACLREL